MKSSSRNGAKVIWLGVHTTEGMMRVQTLWDWTEWPGSSHAACDETGALWGPEEGFVPYELAAWTLRAANPISENIEQCGWARWSRTEWLSRPLLLDATARWLAERSQARGIPLVHLSLAEVNARKPGVLGHADYTYATGDGTHTDPGPNYPWDVVIDKARAHAEGTEDDMPLTDDDLLRLYKAVWFGAPGAPLVPHELGGNGEWPATTLGAMTARINRDIVAPQVAALRGEIAGLNKALTALASGTGATVDLKAVAAAAKAGAQSALAEGVDVDITVGGQTPA